MDKRYVDLVHLLPEVTPSVFEGNRFALKSGTAIDLFLTDMPRLSVDLDLVFVDHHAARDAALRSITEALSAARVALVGRGDRIRSCRLQGRGGEQALHPPGHNRPVHEVLFSQPLDISTAFENEFACMARNPVVLDALLAVRERLQSELPAALSPEHRQFFVTLVSLEPDWNAAPCPHLSQMSAIQWKLENFRKLKPTNPKKFAGQSEGLRGRLGS